MHRIAKIIVSFRGEIINKIEGNWTPEESRAECRRLEATYRGCEIQEVRKI